MHYLAKLCTGLVLAGSLLLAAPGCGDVSRPERGFDAGPPGTGADGGVAPTASPPAAEIVSGSGTLRGGGMRIDIQLGHPASQNKISGGKITVEGDSAVKR